MVFRILLTGFPFQCLLFFPSGVVSLDMDIFTKPSRLILIAFLLMSSTAFPCRMWAVIAVSGHGLHSENDSSNHYIYHEIETFKTQGYDYDDGWSLVFSDSTMIASENNTFRSALPLVESESVFDSSVALVMDIQSASNIAMGHTRLSTSGASGIPNPHPFIREKGDVTFWFMHNGTLSKNMLMSLLTEDGGDSSWVYSNPPQTFGDGPWYGTGWSSVIDSELLFMWVLKNIEEQNFNVSDGLNNALSELNLVENNHAPKTFVLSDGENLYLYGGSNMLYYTDGAVLDEAPYSNVPSFHRAVMSYPPEDGPASSLLWTALQDNELLQISPSGIDPLPLDILRPNETVTGPFSYNLLTSFPNPFNSSTKITFSLLTESHVDITIYTISGKHVKTLLSENLGAGEHTVTWVPKTVSSGIYLCVLESGARVHTTKMLLVK